VAVPKMARWTRQQPGRPGRGVTVRCLSGMGLPRDRG
jgi:hypothetical protein